MKFVSLKLKSIKQLLLICSLLFGFAVQAQILWTNEGDSFYSIDKNELTIKTLPDFQSKTVISKQQLTPEGQSVPLTIEHFKFSEDQQKALIFTNTKRVWRLNTKGDYWVYDFGSGELSQVGKSLPEATLKFAKFSPDGTKVAYVSENNLYVEDLATNKITALTTDGTIDLINGTFDWAYEEEFYSRDGFRWSPDSKSIAYWQIDASNIKKFYMINNTKDVYSELVPLEYPKVGETPSAAKVGVVSISNAKTNWIAMPGDPSQHYLVRMEFIPNTNDLLIQQLNRKQNNSKLFRVQNASGTPKLVFEESDDAWVDLLPFGNTYAVDYTNSFQFLNGGKSILWTSEKDGWRHLYRISLEGKKELLITKGEYDVIDLEHIDEKGGYVYYMASPDNPTQSYLYRTKLNGKGKNERVSPTNQVGTHSYLFSPTGKYAYHRFSNHYTPSCQEYISVAKHEPLDASNSVDTQMEAKKEAANTEFFTITTAEGVEMSGWMVKPKEFDPSKKYPIVFYVYTEPAGTTVTDTYGVSRNFLYAGNMADDGYIYISLDNRGTPAPKGREWRKSIYRKIGVINIDDQAAAAREILKWDYVDPDRVAVWGWSGGGSATLNLLFRYPEIYKTGIAVAAVANQLTYDNIYQERYMGLPQENKEDFVNGSPITHAKNLQGNLLYIHGTGDDNVHYQNADMLINELVKYNKQFQVMPYPNRSHGMSEGQGTFRHLATLYTNFLREHCPPGGK